MEYIILALATWRIASLLATENGPYNVFGRLRELVGVDYNGNGQPFGKNVVAEGLTCVWCVSVWIGATFALGWWLVPTITVLFGLPFALSGATIVINGVIEWLEHRSPPY